MRIDERELSTIRTRVEYDDNENPVYQHKWEGDTNYIAISFELLENGDTRGISFCSAPVLFIGDEGYVGPYRLRVIGVNNAREYVIFERTDDGLPIWVSETREAV